MIYRSVGLVLATVLLFSGLQHIKNPFFFLGTVYSYGLTDPTTGLWVAVLVPISQLVLSAMVYARLWERGVGLLLTAMFSAFTIAQTLVVAKGIVIPCGCFGSDMDTPIGWLSLSWISSLSLASAWYSRQCFCESGAKDAPRLEV
jgi:hypothetical protein